MLLLYTYRGFCEPYIIDDGVGYGVVGYYGILPSVSMVKIEKQTRHVNVWCFSCRVVIGGFLDRAGDKDGLFIGFFKNKYIDLVVQGFNLMFCVV